MNKSNDTLFLQRQVGHLKSWMLSLYAHKSLLCTCLSRAWRVALAQLCGKPMSPLKPLMPSVLCVRANISVRERPSTDEKKVRGKEEGKQVWNCWHCDHNVRNGDDWCDEGTDRRKWGALACISLHALKQHELSHTGPQDQNSAGFWEGSTSLAQGAMWQILNEVELCPPWTGNDLLGLVRLIIHISHPQEKGVLIDFIKHFRCYFPFGRPNPFIPFQDTFNFIRITLFMCLAMPVGLISNVVYIVFVYTKNEKETDCGYLFIQRLF